MEEASVQLSEAQQHAIQAPIDRPLLILAAAGSGKTLVVCHRILYLISQGVSPRDILAVTFTRRAGQDLLSRLQRFAVVSQHNDTQIKGIRVSTFHSFCLSVLRGFPTHADLENGFTIFTPKMQLELLQELVEKWYIKEKNEKLHHNGPLTGEASSKNFPEEIRQETHEVSREQKRIFRIEAYQLYRQFRNRKNARREAKKEVCGNTSGNLFDWVWTKYQIRLREVNAIDFNDFASQSINILQRLPEALDATGLAARYVLVDEFQDTDTHQFELLKLVCRDHNHLTVVGDDDQQIYSWRGATGFRNFSMFGTIFSGSSITKLEQNFRSTGAIVAAARSIISKNKSRMPKTIRTVSPTGTILTVCECRNVQCEAAAVANFITMLKQQDVALHDIVVLYRLQRVGLEIQQFLRARGIKCKIKGSGSVSNEIHPGWSSLDTGRELEGTGEVLHAVLAALRLVICDSDDLACRQIMKVVCPSSNSYISACIRHLQLVKGMPLFHAIKATRLHILGLMKCDSLNLFDSARSFSNFSDTDKNLNWLHSISRIVIAVEKDANNLGMKDIVMNLLQQIAPFIEEPKEKAQLDRNHEAGMDYRKENQVSVTEKESQGKNSFKFTGVKSLLREAAFFDMGTQDLDRNLPNKGLKCSSYNEILRKQGDKSRISWIRSQEGPIERLRNFLDHVSLRMLDGELGEYELNDKKAADSYDQGVTLSTIHQAKGLEWTAVILVRANEGVLPMKDHEVDEQCSDICMNVIDSGFMQKLDEKIISPCSNNIIDAKATVVLGPPNKMVLDDATCIRDAKASTKAIAEEERRLMYVALTRAKRFVLITHIMLDNGQQMLPSRFLGEIPPGLIRRTTCYSDKIKPMSDPSLKQNHLFASSADIDFQDSARHSTNIASKERSNFISDKPDIKCSSRNCVKKKRKSGRVPDYNVSLQQAMGEIDMLLDSCMEKEEFHRLKTPDFL